MSDIYQTDKLTQLQLLREQTKLTGALHEAQVMQLKIWPLVLFQDAKSSKFTWDPDTKLVSFELKLKKATKITKKNQERYQERVGVLNGWVGQLLGDLWHVAVRFECNTPMTLYGQRNVDDRQHRTSRDSESLAGAKRGSTHRA